MRFLVEEREAYDQVVVYAYHSEPDGRRVAFTCEQGSLYVKVVGPGDELPALLRLDRTQFAALKEAIAAGPPTSPEQDAVVDARATRDRLLTLVETAWKDAFPMALASGG